jgi:signal transduction histidine kinase
MSRQNWPVALALLFLALLAWYLVYTEGIVRAVRTDAGVLTRMFAEVQEGIANPSPEAADQALFELQALIVESGVPLILTGPGDTVYAAENLPFPVDLDAVEGQARVREYVRRLDARNPPVGDASGTHLHYGDPPDLWRLRWIPWLQAAGLLLTVLTGLLVIRSQRRAEGERAWTAMARELAHQLGTPISSLQGWLEVLSLPASERPGVLDEGDIAAEIGEDLKRLERISHRFELIGQEPQLQCLELEEVIRSLERYLQMRLPKMGPGVELIVELPDDLPPLLGNSVLLAWALENIVKNALDALAGRGGRISLRASHSEPAWLTLWISDNGPGVDPSVRDRLFDPGVTTKSGGWGVGLALSRRIIEGVHRGRIELSAGGEGGATFRVRLPVAQKEGRTGGRRDRKETTGAEREFSGAGNGSDRQGSLGEQ